jgi:hypothetical protein
MYWYALLLSVNILKTFYGVHTKNITLQTYIRKLVAKQLTLLTANSAVNPFHYSTSCYQQQFYNPTKAARELPSRGTVHIQGAERLYPPGRQYLHEEKKKLICPLTIRPHNQQILFKACIANISVYLLTRRKLIRENHTSNELHIDSFRVTKVLNTKFKFYCTTHIKLHKREF